MAIWDKFRGKKPQVTTTSRFPLTGWADAPERSGKGYMEAYGEIYALFGIALRIATATSEVKWRLYKGSERSERSQVSDHVILNLLDYVNPWQTGQELIEIHSLHTDLAGRAYWYLPKNKLGVPAEIWLLPPHMVKVVPGKSEFIKGYILRVGSEAIPLSNDEVIRFSMPDPLNPYGGIGFVQAASVELDSESYAGKWNRNFFFNSARPDAALEVEDTLSEEQFDRLRQQWGSKYQGYMNSHKVAILEGGVKYKQIAITQKDMDFPALRRQTRENLMFTFGMPLSVMGVSENVNKANAEAGEYTFGRWLVKPRLSRIKHKLNERLVPMFPMAEGLELDFDEVVSETVEEKKGLAESGTRSGWMTINEARKLNGFDPLPNGDQLLIPLNMIATPVKSVSPVKTKSLPEVEKENIWRSYALKTEREESQFITKLNSLFSKQKQEVVKDYTQMGELNEAYFESEKTRDLFVDELKPLIALALREGAESLKEIGDYNEETEWLEERALALATGINQTTKLELKRQIQAGIKQGESIAKIARRIRIYFDVNSKYRAKMIARTEVIAAHNEGALTRYQGDGVQKTEFYAALDERTCDECMALHGEIYPVTEAHGLIPVHPQCRCTFLPVIE